MYSYRAVTRNTLAKTRFYQFWPSFFPNFEMTLFSTRGNGVNTIREGLDAYLGQNWGKNPFVLSFERFLFAWVGTKGKNLLCNWTIQETRKEKKKNPSDRQWGEAQWKENQFLSGWTVQETCDERNKKFCLIELMGRYEMRKKLLHPDWTVKEAREEKNV
jgi:hypothetical protein